MPVSRMLNTLSADHKPTFLKRHSTALRVWHWLLFLAISGSMITVLLNSTVLKSRHNVSLVQTELARSGVAVTSDQARGVAREFSDKIWLVHKIFGYTLIFFLLSRLVIEFSQPSGEKIFDRIRKAVGFYREPELKTFYRHYLAVRYGYLAFYVLLTLMAITGLVLAYEDVGFLKGIHETAKVIHEYGQYLLYAYVVFHVGGVILSELGTEKGLVSGMIHGKYP